MGYNDPVLDLQLTCVRSTDDIWQHVNGHRMEEGIQPEGICLWPKKLLQTNFWTGVRKLRGGRREKKSREDKGKRIHLE